MSEKPAIALPPGIDLPSLCLAITQHAPLPIATVDGATHLVRYANPAFCRLMETDADQLVGRALSEILPEKDTCIELLDRVFQSRLPESHIERDISKPHPVFWAYTIWPVLHDEGLVGVMLQVTETSEFHGKTLAVNEALLLGAIRQHELVEAAEQLNAQLRAEVAERERIAGALAAQARQLAEKARLLDLTQDAIIVRGIGGEVCYWNRGAEKLYGWSREEALGKISHQLLQTKFIVPMEEMLAELNRTNHWVGELIHTTRDGRQITVLVRKTLDRDSHGNPAAVVENISDFTGRRALEDARVARAEELARADRSKDEFLAMLAHELRNPLAPLRNAAEILQTTEATEADRQQAKRIIVRQIENMSRMIDDLLDVSRITEGKIELRKEPVALEAILNAAISLARLGCAARHQELVVAMPATPIFLNGDATRLEQVFNNLLGNACKYSGNGSRISLSAERATGIDPPEVIVRVRDNGVGIEAELLPRVFDLFVQATRALDRSHGGLGIGLTLVNRLVKLHGGSVEARSEGLGHGSEFIVHLPILPQPPPPPAPPLPVAQETSRRILIVDDNMDSARSMGILQARRGHVTRVAFTGPDALAIAAEFLPEVVLLDIGLPGMDGFEVARRLRVMPSLKNARVIAMTGYASPEDLKAAKQAGFDEHLVKPVDLEVLRELLRKDD